ncbi:hypothetical protein M378DRAFT_18543 [Amanita muscaria Koide BX008]|uniref:Uncharacterized protein n=1 Tax=Amanita muscaria (strain Koide BX008) TaxID=946122 RepID=A0A0C2W105_AMAMK|nr:hypothetical protein M378DRAFT_18543 [Amanita muscaria Koide BX008]
MTPHNSDNTRRSDTRSHRSRPQCPLALIQQHAEGAFHEFMGRQETQTVRYQGDYPMERTLSKHARLPSVDGGRFFPRSLPLLYPHSLATYLLVCKSSKTNESELRPPPGGPLMPTAVG